MKNGHLQKNDMSCRFILAHSLPGVHTVIMMTNHKEATMASKTRTLGTCAVCGATHKVPNGKIADHGYRRPGIGFGNVGGCPGSQQDPLEVSSKGAMRYLRNLIASEEILVGQIKRLHDGTLCCYSKRLQATIEPGHEKYEGLRVGTLAEKESSLRAYRSEITRIEKVIADWTPGTVVEIDEEVVARAKREASVAKRAEAMKAKLGKLAATKARKAQAAERKATREAGIAAGTIKAYRVVHVDGNGNRPFAGKWDTRANAREGLRFNARLLAYHGWKMDGEWEITNGTDRMFIECNVEGK
jgi:hypothetical protein